MGPGFLLMSPGFQVRGKVLGSWVPPMGLGSQVPGPRSQVPGPAYGSKVSGPAYWFWVLLIHSGCWVLVAGSQVWVPCLSSQIPLFWHAKTNFVKQLCKGECYNTLKHNKELK